MEIPQNYKYSREHTWLKTGENNEALIGITQFAQSELGEIVYVDLPSVGKQFKKDEIFGSVEAVKTTSDLYMPVSGEVIESNRSINDRIELVNTAPFTEGWMIKIKLLDLSELTQLLNGEGYEDLIR